MPAPASHMLDHRLRAFLTAGDAKEESACMEEIARLLTPILKGMIGRRRLGDIEDLEENCLAAALKAVSDLKRRPSTASVENAESYLVRVIANECNRSLRARHPARHRLKNELMDIFTGRRHIRGLALWEGQSGERLCGYTAWQGRPRTPTPLYHLWQSDPTAFRKRVLGRSQPQEMELGGLLGLLFDTLKTPVEVEEIVGMIAEIKNIRETAFVSLDALAGDDRTPGSPGLLADCMPLPEDIALNRLEAERFLKWLWQEIVALPVSQRKALLFHLETEEVMTLSSVAGWKEIAHALEIPADAMTSLLKSLPLPDSETAALLGVSRQGVINLRKSACSRLSRREKRLETN
ncbi:MAG: hypothetical protein IT210_23690 [Armatimonadetes bacterium]|nr:hypothetical protein [Armatimonadota bacterium]